MAGDISVVLRADPAQFEQGVQATEAAIDKFIEASESGAENVDEAFAEVLRGLVQLGRQSGRTRTEMVADLRSLGLSAEDAEDAIDAIARESRDLGREGARDISRVEDAVDDLGGAAKKSGEDVETIGDKASGVGDGLRDLGDIARSVLEGDFGEAASGAISALTGVAGAIAGGAVGGAITAAVGGIVGGWIDSWNQAARESEERINTWADKFIDAQGRVLDESTILAEVQRILTDDAGKYADAQSIAAAAGIDLSVVLRALAGDTEDLAMVSERMAGTDAEYAEVMAAMAKRSYEITSAEKSRFDELQRGRAGLERYVSEIDVATEKYGLYTRVVEAGREEVRRSAEATERLRDGLLTMPENVKVKVELDDRAARDAFDRFRRDTSGKVIGIRVQGTGPAARQILGG